MGQRQSPVLRTAACAQPLGLLNFGRVVFCVRLTQLDASRWVAKTSSAGPASELAASPADPLNARHQKILAAASDLAVT